MLLEDGRLRRLARGAVPVGLALLLLSCGGGSPTAPTPGALSAVGVSTTDGDGVVTVQHDPNSPPTMVLRTTPRATSGDPYPEITGVAPLLVKFNLCNSTDPDQAPDDNPSAGEGDTLNWQFHFGDDGSEAFRPDGTFNPNFEHFCRAEHTYSQGRYVATVSVTDKHLEDQGNDVSALARVTQKLTIIVSGEGGAPAPGLSAPASLTTLFASNNSFAGNTFDLQPLVPLQITSFDVNVSTPGPHSVTIYWRLGTAQGNESSAAGWTLLGNDPNVIGAGLDAPSRVNVGGLTLTPGNVYGIYVDLTSYPSGAFSYTNGGPTTFSNADLQLTTFHGKGNPAFTGGTFFPRQWNGTVNYVK